MHDIQLFVVTFWSIKYYVLGLLHFETVWQQNVLRVWILSTANGWQPCPRFWRAAPIVYAGGGPVCRPTTCELAVGAARPAVTFSGE